MISVGKRATHHRKWSAGVISADSLIVVGVGLGRAERKATYAATDLRNDRTVALGINYRDFNDSLRDMAESLISVGEVDPVLRDGYALNK